MKAMTVTGTGRHGVVLFDNGSTLAWAECPKCGKTTAEHLAEPWKHAAMECAHCDYGFILAAQNPFQRDQELLQRC